MNQKFSVGIILPHTITKFITSKRIGLEDLPVKWVRPDLYYILVLPLGYLINQELYTVSNALYRVCSDFEQFDIALTKLDFGPSPEKPQHIWITGSPSKELLQLRENMEKALDIFIAPKKSFKPQIDLGRIRKNRFEELSEKPHITEVFQVTLNVSEIVIVTPVEKKGKRELEIIESFNLC